MTIRNTALAFAASVAALPATADELIYNTGLGPTHPTVTDVMEPMAAWIAEQTDGQTTMKVVTAGALAGIRETLSAVQSGAVELGLVNFNYTPDVWPVTAALGSLSLIGKDNRVMTAAAAQSYLLDCERCQAEYEAAGVVPLFVYSTTPFKLMCRGIEPLTPEAMVGVKMRASAGVAQAAAALGATPLNMQSTETYEGVQRGAINCDSGSVSWLKTYNFGEVMSVVVNQSFGVSYNTGLMTFGQDAWQDVSPEAKDAIFSYLAKGFTDISRGYIKADEAARAEFEPKGVKFVDPDPSFGVRMDAIVNEQFRLIVDQATARGVSDVDAELTMLTNNVAKWTEIVDGIGTGDWGDAEWQAYQDAVQTEIVDRLERKLATPAQ